MSPAAARWNSTALNSWGPSLPVVKLAAIAAPASHHRGRRRGRSKVPPASIIVLSVPIWNIQFLQRRLHAQLVFAQHRRFVDFLQLILWWLKLLRNRVIREDQSEALYNWISQLVGHAVFHWNGLLIHWRFRWQQPANSLDYWTISIK